MGVLSAPHGYADDSVNNETNAVNENAAENTPQLTATWADPTGVGQTGTVTVTVPATTGGTVTLYMDGYALGAPTAITENTQESQHTIQFSIPSYGEHTMTLRFSDAEGHNPLKDLTHKISFNTAPTPITQGASDQETYTGKVTPTVTDGVNTDNDGSFEKPFVVNKDEKITYTSTITLGQTQSYYEQGIVPPEGLSVTDSEIIYETGDSKDSERRICTSGTTEGKCSSWGSYQPRWASIFAMTSGYRGIQTNKGRWVTDWSVPSKSINLTVPATVGDLAPGTYPSYVAMYKAYTRSEYTHSIVPLEKGYIKVSPIELPERKEAPQKVTDPSTTDTTTEDTQKESPKETDPVETTTSTAEPATSDVAPVETTPGETSASVADPVAESAKVKTVSRETVITDKCHVNGLPRSVAPVEGKVGFTVEYPESVETGSEFKIKIIPNEFVLPGKADIATVQEARRFKVDFELPDPEIATYMSAVVNSDGKGISGKDLSIIRVDRDGNPDDNGELLRLSGDNETVNNGPKANDKSSGGMVVAVNGQDTKFSIPSVELSFKAQDSLPGNADSANFFTTIRNKDENALADNKEQNFLSFGLRLRAYGFWMSGFLNCTPDTTEAEQHLFDITVNKKASSDDPVSGSSSDAGQSSEVQPSEVIPADSPKEPGSEEPSSSADPGAEPSSAPGEKEDPAQKDEPDKKDESDVVQTPAPTESDAAPTSEVKEAAASDVRSRKTVIDDKCYVGLDGMPKLSVQEGKVGFTVEYPATVETGKEFKVKIIPNEFELPGTASGVSITEARRFKVDFELPNPDIATYMSAAVNKDGSGVSGKELSIIRVDRNGNPSADGELLRLSGNNETVNNGPNADPNSSGGMVVPVNGEDTKFRIPSIELTFKAKDTLPEDKDSAIFFATIRNDATSLAEDVEQNFLSFGVNVDFSGQSLGAVLNCTPNAEHAKNHLFDITVHKPGIVVTPTSEAQQSEQSSEQNTEPSSEVKTSEPASSSEPSTTNSDKGNDEPKSSGLPSDAKIFTVDGKEYIVGAPVVRSRSSVISGMCRSNGAPANMDDQQRTDVRFTVKYPSYALVGSDFVIEIQPDEMELPATNESGTADFDVASRFKIDFELPDPSLAQFISASFGDDARNISIDGISVIRINRNGEPDSQGDLLRLSGNNETVNNGPKSAKGAGGLTVNINGQDTKFKMPTVYLRFKAVESLADGSQKVPFGTTVRKDTQSLEFNNPANFLTFNLYAVPKIKAISPVDLEMNCNPINNDVANRELFEVNIRTVESFSQGLNDPDVDPNSKNPNDDLNTVPKDNTKKKMTKLELLIELVGGIRNLVIIGISIVGVLGIMLGWALNDATRAINAAIYDFRMRYMI